MQGTGGRSAGLYHRRRSGCVCARPRDFRDPLMRYSFAAAATLLLTSLAACDFVRFPGDGGPPPSIPDEGPVTPPGAPGPPPPDMDDTTDPETPVETTPEDGTAPELDPVDAPDAGDGDTTTPVEIPVEEPSTGDPETPVTEPETPVTEPETPVEEPPAQTPVFSFFAPGALLAGSGGGFADQVAHAPDMIFPI